MGVVSAEQVHAWLCGVENLSDFMPEFLIQAPPESLAKAPPLSAGTVGGVGTPPREVVKPADTSKVQVYEILMLCSGIFTASRDLPGIHHHFTLFHFYQSTSGTLLLIEYPGMLHVLLFIDICSLTDRAMRRATGFYVVLPILQ